MSDSPAPAAEVWLIRCVPVRTRDGPERLAQAYRRLLYAGAGQAERPGTYPPVTPPSAPRR